jgi:XRE family transcriptional regulator, regulator of sulfur utilization
VLTRRDIYVALTTLAVCAGVSALAYEQKTIIGSSIYDWNDIPAHKTDVGEVRSFFRGPTATLNELEVHVTTLNPGQASHPPHQHPNEELVIIKDGTVEAYIDGKWKQVGPGSVIFAGSNQLHGVRNSGSTPATYHVINWSSAATPAAKP